MTATIERLTEQAFAQFGAVVQTEAAKHTLPLHHGFIQRFHDLVDIDVDARGGRLGVSILRCAPRPMPLRIAELERQRLSSTTLMPLNGYPYLVVVAPPGKLQESAIRVFFAEGHQGVHYRAGIWHHACLALYRNSDFLLLDRLGKGSNTDKVALQNSFYIRAGDL